MKNTRLIRIVTAGLALGFLLGGCNSSGGGATASTPSANQNAAPPAGPQVQLSWTAATGGPSGYYIMMSLDNSTYTLATTVSGGASTTGTVTGLSKGTTYYFKVEAYNAGGASSPSGSVTVTTNP